MKLIQQLLQESNNESDSSIIEEDATPLVSQSRGHPRIALLMDVPRQPSYKGSMIFLQSHQSMTSVWLAYCHDLQVKSWKMLQDQTYCYPTHAQEVACQAAMVHPPDEVDLDYEPTKNASARNLVLETKHGTLVDYMDHFEKKMSMHIEHCNLVSSEHRSKLLYSWNS